MVAIVANDDVGMVLVLAMAKKDGQSVTATPKGRNPSVSTRRCPGEASASPYPSVIRGWH